MQQLTKIGLRTLMAAIGLTLLCLTLLMIAANTPQGRGFIERTVAKLSSDEVLMTGLSGQFPYALQLNRLELRDSGGSWLTLNNVILEWTPTRLLTGTIQIDQLETEHISLGRLPTPSSEPTSENTAALPIKITINRLHIAHIDLAEAVVGQRLSMAVNGDAQLASLEQGNINFAVQRLDKAGAYNLKGHLDRETVQAQISIQEPDRGLIAGLADLQGHNPLSVEAVLEGPLAAAQTQFNLTLGELNASLEGQLDFIHAQADLTVTVSAPAMQPHADIAWQAIALKGKVQGEFTRPTVNSNLHIDNLNIAGTGIHTLALSLQGETGQLHIEGELGGLTQAGSKRDLLNAVPLKLQADVHLDAPDRTVTASLKHPYLTVEGTATTADNPHATLLLALPDLKPWATLANLELQGATTLTLNANQQGDDTQLTLEGDLAITGGAAPIPNLLGEKTKISAAGKLRGTTVDLAHFTLAGKNLTAEAKGSLADQTANFNWKIGLADLSSLSAKLTGKLAAQGDISGAVDNLTLAADLTGELATPNFPRQPLTAKLQLDHLPNAPAGQLKANTVLAGAPLTLAVTAKSLQDNVLQITLDRADWKSANATGHLLKPANTAVPVGTINFRMSHLEDLQALLEQPLSGSVTAVLETKLQREEPIGVIQVTADNVGLAGTATVRQTVLAATVTDLAGQPSINGQVTLNGLATDVLTGSATLDLAGTGEALKLQLSAAFDNPKGDALKLQTIADLDALNGQLTVANLQADWNREKLHLLNPVAITYANGVTVNKLRLGLREATLLMDGRISPNLAMTATVNKLPADLLAQFMPELAATGTLQAKAELNGTLTQPTGHITIEAVDLQMKSGPGRALPVAKLTASATLEGTAAQINVQCDAGTNATLNIRGQAPLNPTGLLALHTTGAINLKLLDPLLTADGRRVRGQINLDAEISGVLSAPVVTGTAQLNNGEIRDYTMGANITGIKGVFRANAGVLTIDQFEGRAGQGSVAVKGTIDLLKPDMPVNLAITARNARPLASDRLTVTLNSDLTISGLVAGQLRATGAVLIKRAEIRIPERMPTSIAVLKFNTPNNAAEEPPPKADSNLLLNLAITATDSIFVRGRGVDAELAGVIKLRGTAANPDPIGSFTLRRGEFSLAGKTLTFTKGIVGFDGGSLTDPSLNLIANSTSDNITATLTITGTANKPKILLSSTPELPQDEILARLLFSRSTASLSTLEMIQIGAAFASLSGTTSGFNDPLESVRKNLNLDRLSVGGADNTVEAGRYVMPGVYVGAKQGMSSSSQQAAVQIDLTKALKLEATVGTASPASKSSGTSSVGIIYQFEY
ncbi:MAG: translocation/assembly module TamB domain-containing protein [Methylovulum sp.]|nr:translocation/assembly module TamB domain-containing protein [Methylovulum sp.]